MISAKIPDLISDLASHKVVKKFRMHGPYGVVGSGSLCMHKGKSTFLKDSMQTRLLINMDTLCTKEETQGSES